MERWYRSLSSDSDIIEFADHLGRVWSQKGVEKKDLSFPRSVFVHGPAYYPIKTAINKTISMERWILIETLKGFVSPAFILNTMGKIFSGAVRDAVEERNNAVLKATRCVAISYYTMENDTGASMNILFTFMSDNLYEQHPDTY